MPYLYYNQRNYAGVPYPSATKPQATVKSGGCGVCCALMALENLTDHRMTVAEMAQFAISHNARDQYGTDLKILLAAMKHKYAGVFDYRFTDNKEELLLHLKTGGAAIANIGGDRGSYKGIFCTTGHFVYVAGLNGNCTIVLDPDQYSGKYSGWRKAHVTMNGNELYCDPIRLDEDCNNRSPRYYLIGGNKTPQGAPAEAAKYRVGDHVTFSTCYRSSGAPTGQHITADKMARSHGTITRIVSGASNPYLLDDGLCWVNDGDIRGYYSAARTGTVATNRKPLNVRNAPNGSVIGSIPKGAAVEITGESGGWYKVSYNGVNGYASKEYIR